MTIIIELRTAPRYKTGNGVNGKNDIEGKAARGAASEFQPSGLDDTLNAPDLYAAPFSRNFVSNPL
jgi:hypothetical protein